MKARLPLPPAFGILLAAALAPWQSHSVAGTNGPGTQDSICPTITVECPETVARPGEDILFALKMSGAGPAPDLTFKWKTSAGTVASGSEGVVTTSNAERTAVVDTTGLPGNSTVTATVEFSGLDRSCVNTASCATAILQPLDPHALDRYGDISYGDEQARLDNFAVELQSFPSLNGYIVCYGGRGGRRGEALARCARARRYLVRRRGLAPDRLVLVDGGYQENLNVSLWLLPPGTDFTPSPTVHPNEVKSIKPTKKQKSRTTSRRRPGK